MDYIKFKEERDLKYKDKRQNASVLFQNNQKPQNTVFNKFLVVSNANSIELDKSIDREQFLWRTIFIVGTFLT